MARELTEQTYAKSGWRDRFLKCLAKCANVSDAARSAGVSRPYAYQVKAADPEFAAAWEDCEQQAIDRLEKEAFKRAKKQPDLLLIFLLKSRRRPVYGDRVDVNHLIRIIAEMRALSPADLLQVLGYNEQSALADSDPAEG